MDKVVESGFSSLPDRGLIAFGSAGRPVGVAIGLLLVKLWNSVVAGGAGAGGFNMAAGVASAAGRLMSAAADGLVPTGGIAGTAVAVAAGGHWL